METEIQVFDSEMHQWILSHYPKMPADCTSSVAVGFQNYLIVACGCKLKKIMSVLNCSNWWWYKAQPLPIGGKQMSAAIMGGCWHISSYGWSDYQSHVFSQTSLA